MRFIKLLLLLTLFFCLNAVSTRAQKNAQTGEEFLTNASVIKLVRAGFSEKAVIAIIRSRPTRFDLSPDRLIELKRSRVSEKIILAMLSLEGSAGNFSDEDWGTDDEGFDNDLDQGDKKSDKKNKSGEVDIFGSSGGTRGRSRSRGGNGSASNDTQTTGSVSVQIVRPNKEGGTQTPKLERTPTLTNEEIIKLVEAGFTEGTIIRRIEQSPVEFDLSSTKLEELRRHRVSENVIAAMRAAMGEEKPSTNNPTSPER